MVPIGTKAPKLKMALISFKYNFIFVKTAKTAGTSIEVDLSCRLEEQAVVTPIMPRVAGHHARNFRDPKGLSTYYNHMSATEIREHLGEDKFTSMHKFCVAREPVSKCISHFHMLRNSVLYAEDRRGQSRWDEYVEIGKFPNDCYRYSEVIEGERRSLISQFLRYDRLVVELPEMLSRLGIADFELRSRAKSEYSKFVLIKPEQVTAQQRQKIYDVFEENNKLTGIDWEA